MKWFKFYGQDFLTDTKLIGIDPLLKVVWVTLLCMADEDGVIEYLKEIDLQRLANCDESMSDGISDFERTEGCLRFFEERKMISLQIVTDSNASHNSHVTYSVKILNYISRQTENLSNAERQRRYRERHNLDSKSVQTNENKSNITQRNDSNARIDKNRIDKNIKRDSKERKIENSLSYLENIPSEDIKYFTTTWDCSERQLKEKGLALVDWCKSNNKRKADYKAFLRNAIRKDFKLQPSQAQPVIYEFSKSGLAKVAEIKSKLEVKSMN